MRILILCLALLCAVPAQAEDLNSIYQGYAADTETALDQPHRGIAELGAWLSEVVANCVQFTPGNAAQKLTQIRPYFSDQGFKSYTDFLAAQGYGAMLNAQTLNLTSVVNSAPMLIGQGASAGRYAWAYEMPVVLSASSMPGSDPINKTVILRIQVGRNAAATNPMGVLIESWQVFVEPPAAAANPANDSGQPVGAP